MKNYSEYLRKEADYQDLKISQNRRTGFGVFYNDEASKYRYECRNAAIGAIYNKKVLDLGCGSGFASIDALRMGAYVTAIDISPKSIEDLINVAKQENLVQNLDARVMDAHCLEFEDETFDIVFGNGILHHLIDFQCAVSEIHRVLKPSGVAVFLEPLGMNPIINLFRKMTPDCRTSDEKPLTMRELAAIKQVFPDTQFSFFEFTTLIAKVLCLLKLSNFAKKIQGHLIKVDNAILKARKADKITIAQKLSWMILMKMKK